MGLPWAPRRTAWVGQQGASIFRRRGNLNSYPLSSPQRGQAVLRGRVEFKTTRVGAPSGPSTDLAGKPPPVSKTGAREGVWVRIPPAPFFPLQVIGLEEAFFL